MTEINISVDLRLLLEHDAVAAGQSADTHVVVELVPRGEGVENLRPPLSVAFVLDISGSMNGPPLEHVQGSVEMLLDLLDESDRAGVVAFSDNATVVAPLETLDRDWKSVVKSRVRRLETEGCTNMSAGLEKARELLGPRQEHERQLVLLLTDGMPNRGISDAGGLAEIAGAMRPDVVTVTLGYGPHHSEDLLAGVAKAGSGEYFYIANPLEADDAFARAVGAQGDVVADAVELIFRPQVSTGSTGAGASSLEIVEFLSPVKPRFGPHGLTVAHPDLLAGRSRYIIAALQLTAPGHHGPWPALDVELGYRVAGTSERRQARATLEIPVKQAPGQLVPEAHMRVLLDQAERARAEARALADRGHYDGAAAVIRDLIEKLEAAEGFRPGDGSVLADALEQLVDERVAYERRPSMEEYRDYKRMQLGVAMQDGGWHHSERTMQSEKSRGIAMGSQRDLPSAQIVVTGPGGHREQIALAGEASIGRVNGNDVVLPSGSVSKRHTRIVGRRGQYIVIDLKSTNGTYLGHAKLDAPHVLRSGDVLQIGDFELHYQETGQTGQSGDEPDSGSEQV